MICWPICGCITAFSWHTTYCQPLGLVDEFAETDYHACGWVAGGTVPSTLATMDQIFRRYVEIGHHMIGEGWVTTLTMARTPLSFLLSCFSFALG